MSQPNNLPTLNQYLGPGGNFPQTIPASGVPEQNVQPQPQQGNWGQPPQQGNWNQPPQQGNWGQPPQQGNWNQPPQGNWNQPPQGNYQPPQGNYQPPQGNYQPPQQQGNWNQPPQQPGNWGQQQNPQSYAQQPGHWNQAQQNFYGNNFFNEVAFFRSKYGLNFPDSDIDQTYEAARANKRMYAFNEPEKNYIRYDEKGKSYVLTAHTFGWAHKNNKQFFEDKPTPNSFDGTSSYLIKVCWIDVKLEFKHVKPGNYQVFINQSFDNAQIKGKMKIKVLVQDHEVFGSDSFPNEEMVKNRNLTEVYICKIRVNDFDNNRLDQFGDGKVRVEISGTDSSWKKGWTIDGVRLLESN